MRTQAVGHQELKTGSRRSIVSSMHSTPKPPSASAVALHRKYIYHVLLAMPWLQTRLARATTVAVAHCHADEPLKLLSESQSARECPLGGRGDEEKMKIRVDYFCEFCRYTYFMHSEGSEARSDSSRCSGYTK